MKLIYAGTPDFAIAPLESIINAGHEVVAVITQEDKPVGRKGILTPPPVKVFAEKHGIRVLQFTKIREHVEELKSLGAKTMVTCAYGQLLTQEVIDVFEDGIYNIHASLLPKYRGASPIQWAIIEGENETGITIMRTDIGMDTGDILLRKKMEIGHDTCASLSEKLSELGAKCIIEALELLEKGEAVFTPQDNSLATKVKKINKSDAKIDFSKSAKEIERLILGMNPSPVAHCILNGNPFNVYDAEVVDFEGGEREGEVVCAEPKKGLIVKCKEGYIRMLSVQESGKKQMSARDYLLGRKVKTGDVFS